MGAYPIIYRPSQIAVVAEHLKVISVVFESVKIEGYTGDGIPHPPFPDLAESLPIRSSIIVFVVQREEEKV